LQALPAAPLLLPACAMRDQIVCMFSPHGLGWDGVVVE
jgi:hypothetical protein